MRLHKLESGHGFVGRLKLTVIRAVSGRRAPDVVRLLLYRPEVFGTPFSDLVHRALRGTSSWSPGERELFAAYTAKLSDCEF